MLLLDTHTLIWFIQNDKKLAPYASQQIMESETVFVSAATLWEIAIKMSIGKLDIGDEFDNMFPTHLEQNGFTMLPIELKHFSQVVQLPYYHRDPFDRLLIAQSMTEKLPIISKDRFFDAYGVTRLWDNQSKESYE